METIERAGLPGLLTPNCGLGLGAMCAGACVCVCVCVVYILIHVELSSHAILRERHVGVQDSLKVSVSIGLHG